MMILRYAKFIRQGRPFSVAIIGAPGSGKGTICKRIIEHFDLQHISSGDLLRSHVLKKTSIGKSVDKYMSSGQLVPDEVVINIIMEEIKSKNNINVLFDGYPRTRHQAQLLDEHLTIHHALNFQVPFSLIIERVSKRWIHPSSGRVYNEDFNPPQKHGIDDLTGDKLVQRIDDKPEAVSARLNSYGAIIQPVLDYYQAKQLLCTFQGEKTNEIWPKVYAFLSTLRKPLCEDKYHRVCKNSNIKVQN